MGFINETPSKDSPVCCRAVVAAFLAMMILLVVLLTCLLELVINSDQNSMPISPSPLPTQTTQTTQSPSNCPSRMPGLVPFPEGTGNIILNNGINYILQNNATIGVLQITNGASLTVLDNGSPILLAVKRIQIDSQGSLLIGSEDCPHQSYLEILLTERSNDTSSPAHTVFGQNYIGVGPTASIDIHGPWKFSWTFLETTIQPNSSDIIVNLTDSHKMSWRPGDMVVIASSDYDMEHAEEFELEQCDSCSEYQIKIKGPAKYIHFGGVGDIQMKAEVGMLTHNIKIHGKMEDKCYGNNKCQDYSYDTFGGSIQILRGTRIARIEGVELYNMGQQPVSARYPIHFHRVFEAYGYYARQLSIHHCFSRCITIHATTGLLVEDVVGYDTLGHCFFFSDGNELYNRLNHNLGLVTKPGTLLPSDRNDTTCIQLTANRTAYTPNPAMDCNGVSTFWVAHPYNYFTNNSAGGSAKYGFFFLFHREPTGPSAGLLPPFHGERSQLGSFVGNRAHSNQLFGFFMDRGVKIDNPSATDPRDFLALTNLERYQPHVDRNLSLPRAPAHLVDFTAYMNSVAMFVRGGDVWISNATLSDNDVGVIMSSSPYLPYDQGSHQELVDSLVVGRTLNNTGWNNRSVPCVGVEIRDGPIVIRDNVFLHFPQDNSTRMSYAIGFYPNNSGQSSPANVIVSNEFVDVDTPLFFGQVGGLTGTYFGNRSLDGDLTEIVHVVGNSGGLQYSDPVYAVRLDNPLTKADNTCYPNGTFAVCTDRNFGQLFVNASSKTVKFSISDRTLQSDPLMLEGADRYDNQHPTTNQFQPVLNANHTYRINWLTGAAPSSLNFSMHNFDQGSFIRLEICYPSTTNFLNASLFLLNQATGNVTMTGTVPMSSNSSLVDGSWPEAQYFWDASSSLLYVKLQATWNSQAYSYCADDGCHFFNIRANVTYNGEYTC